MCPICNRHRFEVTSISILSLLHRTSTRRVPEVTLCAPHTLLLSSLRLSPLSLPGRNVTRSTSLRRRSGDVNPTGTSGTAGRVFPQTRTSETEARRERGTSPATEGGSSREETSWSVRGEFTGDGGGATSGVRSPRVSRGEPTGESDLL